MDSTEAKKLLKKFGYNKVDAAGESNLSLLLKQFKFPFTYILVVALGVSYFLGQKTDAVMILVFILINTFTGFYMEAKSKKTVELLKKNLALKSKVFRDGKWQIIPAEVLVPGDLVELSTGNIVPADIDMDGKSSAEIDESLITGESAAVSKKDKLFAGSTVISGVVQGTVSATGKNTAIGRMTKLVVETQKESSFEKQIQKFSKIILWLVLGAVILIFAGNILFKANQISYWEMALFSIALAVSVIPEALPLVVTFSFAKGAMSLAKEKVVVKRLSAIEDLGGIEVLCTDKTGTLTENSMVVADIYKTDDKFDIKKFAMSGFYEDAKSGNLNSFDNAILKSLTKSEELIVKKIKVLEKTPFRSDVRYDLCKIKKGEDVLSIYRGAPETILKLCGKAKGKKSIDDWVEARSYEGKRVLAIAKKMGNKTNLLGLISFVDPIKLTSKDAVNKAKELGMILKVLSGDRKEVTAYVAKSLGIIEDEKEVMTGDEFAKLSSKEKEEAVSKVNVFARILPEQKYEIVGLLQKSFNVGFLGDGINDAPALKLANVALVVEGATDIAKDASDIMFLKKDLQVIVDGVNSGRKIFANTTKYIVATLSANFGNFFAIAVSSFIVPFLPMLPTQILLVNLLSDFPMIAMASDNAEMDELKNPNDYRMKRVLSLAGVLGFVSSLFDFIFFGTFYRLGEKILQTGWFMESILTELVFIFSVRSSKPFYKAIKPSYMLSTLTVVAALFTIYLANSSFGINYLEFVHIGAKNLIAIFSIIVCYFVASETAKLLFKKYYSKDLT